jgi:NAD-dependent SIR2 family protein deacetylase
VAEADFFLFVSGAGFSADSGLPVYKVRHFRSGIITLWNYRQFHTGATLCPQLNMKHACAISQ